MVGLPFIYSEGAYGFAPGRYDHGFECPGINDRTSGNPGGDYRTLPGCSMVGGSGKFPGITVINWSCDRISCFDPGGINFIGNCHRCNQPSRLFQKEKRLDKISGGNDSDHRPGDHTLGCTELSEDWNNPLGQECSPSVGCK